MLAERTMERREFDPFFLGQILAPYRPTETDYLKTAFLSRSCLWEDASERDTILGLTGRYSIPSSCYIQSTGHFNAVEFLICYNQLAYVAFGHFVRSRMLERDGLVNTSSSVRERFSAFTYDDYLRDQLASMFILKAATRFKKMIAADDFEGELLVKRLFSRGGTCFADTFCSFRDAQGGYAEGEVLLAYPPGRS